MLGKTKQPINTKVRANACAIISELRRTDMTQASYAQKEAKSQSLFASLGEMYFLCTREDHPLIFTCDEEYKAAIAIFAICCKLFPDVRIITFVFMSNHFHILLCGDSQIIMRLFNMFKQRLQKYFESQGKIINLNSLNEKLHPVSDLHYARNVIVYTNRNAFVVIDDVTPFSYPWGANRYYFNPEMVSLYREVSAPITLRERRGIIHSKYADGINDLLCDDKSISPMCFCDIAAGEGLFRDAKHYFASVSRKVEAYSEIAKVTGEHIYYTDDDMYTVAVNISRERYNCKNLSLLKPQERILLATALRYDYNASDKQIKRFLGLSDNILASL